MESDEALARRVALLRDEPAFAALLLRHETRGLQQLKRLSRDAALAEDLCQETFLRAWNNMHSFKGTGRFGAWLAKLAHRSFLMHYRYQKRRPATAVADVETHPEVANGTVDHQDETPDLEKLLAVVDPEDRRLLALAYAQGLSTGEISEVTGMPPGTVKSQIHRAKLKIRSHFRIERAP